MEEVVEDMAAAAVEDMEAAAVEDMAAMVVMEVMEAAMVVMEVMEAAMVAMEVMEEEEMAVMEAVMEVEVMTVAMKYTAEKIMDLTTVAMKLTAAAKVTEKSNTTVEETNMDTPPPVTHPMAMSMKATVVTLIMVIIKFQRLSFVGV
jgi:hypothetical protein